MEVAEHHHLYLSTILQDIALREHRHRDKMHPSLTGKDKEAAILQLVRSFKVLFKRAVIQQPA